ncbi:bifunctional DNA primase/polymerase [Propioniciclava soli]|uniref:Bifunctional DNA primase/polymerase n=1 Tax=Propioniciclava soli TaxID=2775081 RepID=A0ABZ3C9V8_9ACTN
MAGPDALDVLAKAGRGWRLPHAAILLAEGGVPVFPCAPGGKTPTTRHGHLDATTDRRQVREWWRRSPWANIGIPTGAASGLVVVDVDMHGPANGMEAFVRAGNAGLVKGWGLLVDTPTGGQHAYFPAIPDIEQRSWQAGSAGIDFRGDGGYIVAPPSVRMIDGIPTRYRIVVERLGPASPVDSARLRDFLDPRPTPTHHAKPARDRDGADAERLASWLGRQATDRNLKLFWASCRLAEGGVPVSDAVDAMVSTAQSDFGEREITRTVHSAYRSVGAGARQREPAAALGSSGDGFARCDRGPRVSASRGLS